MNSKYNDIINLHHKQSESRQHMSASERASQFSPFSAVTVDDSIDDAKDIFIQFENID